MSKPHEPGILDYFWHWLRIWCGPKIIKEPNGEIIVEYYCMVCAKRDVLPEDWEKAIKGE